MEAFLAVGRVLNRNFLRQSYRITVNNYRTFPRTNPPNSRPLVFFHSHSYHHHLSNPMGNPAPETGGFFAWHPAPETVGGSVFGRKDAETTVVLLGRLDGKQKHLRRYVEWYNSQGIHAITFGVEVGELLGSDSGERMERRITALAEDITSWVTEDGLNGYRCLLFHTFSNTGFLTYGLIEMSSRVVLSKNSILGYLLFDYWWVCSYAYVIEILLGKAGGVTDKVRGCVVDSGGAGLFNQKIWAAGFAAALLKRNSLTSQEASKQNADQGDKTVTLLVGVLEKSFAVVLKSPQVDQKLRKMLVALSKNQLCYPRLYLYSTGDSIVPHEAIKAVIMEEKGKGRKVESHDFGSSPHVDPYRSFPETYISLLQKFLKQCFSISEPAGIK